MALPVKCCRGAAKRPFLSSLGVLVAIPPCEGIRGRQCPLNLLLPLILFKEKNQGGFSCRGLWSRAEASTWMLLIKLRQMWGSERLDKQLAWQPGGSRLGLDGPCWALGLGVALRGPCCACPPAQRDWGSQLPRDLFFPQDPPSEPGSPSRAPSSRLPPARREMPESPASITSSRSTTPLKPKDQSLVGSSMGSPGRGWAVELGTWPQISLGPVCHSPKVGEETPVPSAWYPLPDSPALGAEVRALRGRLIFC